MKTRSNNHDVEINDRGRKEDIMAIFIRALKEQDGAMT